MKEDIRELQTEMKEVKADIKELQTEMKEVKEDIQGMKVDIQDTKDDVQELKVEAGDLRSSVTVSYTHLDVYKRQSVFSADAAWLSAKRFRGLASSEPMSVVLKPISVPPLIWVLARRAVYPADSVLQSVQREH